MLLWKRKLPEKKQRESDDSKPGLGGCYENAATCASSTFLRFRVIVSIGTCHAGSFLSSKV